MSIDELLKLKKDIDQAKIDVSKLEGQKEQILSDLQEKWNCSNVEQAKKKYDSKKSEIQKLQNQIDKGLEELDEELETITNQEPD